MSRLPVTLFVFVRESVKHVETHEVASGANRLGLDRESVHRLDHIRILVRCARPLVADGVAISCIVKLWSRVAT